MKKTFTVFVLVLVLCTCVFASHRVSVTFDPFTFQHFVQKDGSSKNKVNSTYGIGAGLGYDYIMDNGFRAGADVKADTYFLEDQKNFTDLSFLAKAGYAYGINETVSIYGNMKLGLDLQMKDSKTSAVMEFGPELGAEYKFDEKITFFTSCEFLFGFPEKDNIKYSEFRVTPTLGAGYKF